MAPYIPTDDDDIEYEDVEENDEGDERDEEDDGDDGDDGDDQNLTATGKKKRKSVYNRRLQRWDPNVDQLLLLTADIVCAKLGRPIPWDLVARHINTHMTGEGIKQHLTKVMVTRAEAGMVNPTRLISNSARRKEVSNPEQETAALRKKQVLSERDPGFVPRDDDGKTPACTNLFYTPIKNIGLLHIPEQTVKTTKSTKKRAGHKKSAAESPKIPGDKNNDFDTPKAVEAKKNGTDTPKVIGVKKDDTDTLKAAGNKKSDAEDHKNTEDETLDTPVQKMPVRKSKPRTKGSPSPSKQVVLATAQKGGRKKKAAYNDDDVFSTKKSTGKRARTIKAKAKKGSDDTDEDDIQASPLKKKKIVLRSKRTTVNYNEQIGEESETEGGEDPEDDGAYVGEQKYDEELQQEYGKEEQDCGQELQQQITEPAQMTMVDTPISPPVFGPITAGPLVNSNYISFSDDTMANAPTIGYNNLQHISQFQDMYAAHSNFSMPSINQSYVPIYHYHGLPTMGHNQHGFGGALTVYGSGNPYSNGENGGSMLDSSPEYVQHTAAVDSAMPMMKHGESLVEVSNPVALGGGLGEDVELNESLFGEVYLR